MTTLEVVDTAESQAAVAYLLNLIIKRFHIPLLQNKLRCQGVFGLINDHLIGVCSLVFLRVPVPVLMSKFSDTTKALMDIMSNQATSETGSALRWVSGFVRMLRLFYCLLSSTEIDSSLFASIDPVMLGDSVEKAGCNRLDIPNHSPGIPRPAQLHSAQ